MQQTTVPRLVDLDNPMWHALQGPHRRFAEHIGDTCWYPNAIAPFIAIPDAAVVPDLNAAAARGWRDPAYFVGAIPATLTAGWQFASRSQILQLLPTTSPAPSASPDEFRVLSAADRPRMVALMQIAFPDFFRERTAELGEYLGIFQDDTLVAMAGERLALEGLQEISGVCTHPGFVGRGYARRLTRALMLRHRERGVGSFLHVSEENAPARRLYESMGFQTRNALPIARIEKNNSPKR
jgi:GNAT superfamily N-acetyltransferase